MRVILHITVGEQWEEALRHGVYRGDTLEAEGFIHCSTRDQVVGVADARCRGHGGLVLLVIDVDKVRPEIKYEPAENDEVFPHICGPLNADAVVRVVPFPPRSDGTFALPAEAVEPV